MVFPCLTSPVGSVTLTDGVAATAVALGTRHTSAHTTAATEDRTGFTTPPTIVRPQMDENHGTRGPALAASPKRAPTTRAGSKGRVGETAQALDRVRRTPPGRHDHACDPERLPPAHILTGFDRAAENDLEARRVASVLGKQRPQRLDLRGGGLLRVCHADPAVTETCGTA